jgi:hypothetical protein
MKNIHVIPTDKPSRLSILNSGKLNLGAEIMSSSNSKPQHIYITSDEEIKEGDWVIKISSLYKGGGSIQKYSFIDRQFEDITFKKIILTTDQDLINDGVQAIDDIFLEWFVENPSCESVEVDKNWNYPLDKSWEYKLRIIPQEEPKQETLEEAAKRLHQKGLKDDLSLSFHDGVKFGAKWQSERMYSEEEVFNLCRDFVIFIQQKRPSYKKQLEWFEQFKKKGGDK